jgi:uncharacterized membrane protein
MSKVLKIVTLWLWGGFIYYLIELIWRGYSHPSMFIVGGLCLVAIGALNNYLPWDLGFVWQILIGSLIVFILELTSGLIVNVWLELGVWDYSDLAFNLWGQVSLLFFFLFMPVVAFAIWLDDFLRWKLYGYEKPRYKLF